MVNLSFQCNAVFDLTRPDEEEGDRLCRIKSLYFALQYFFFKKSKTNIFSIKIKSGLFVLPRTQNWKDPDFATLDPLLLPSNMSNTPLPSSLSLWKDKTRSGGTFESIIFLQLYLLKYCKSAKLFELSNWTKSMSWVFLSKFYCQTFWGYFSHQRIPFPVCNDSCAYALGCGDDHFRQMFSRLQNFANTHNITSHKNKNVFLGKHEKCFIWPLRHCRQSVSRQNCKISDL